MNLIVKILTFFDRAFAVTIKILLVLILLTMILLGALQVTMRNFFNGGISWSDVAARNMVLWVAFLGAILATRKRQHIAIDAITHFVPEKFRNFIRIFLDIFSSIIAFMLAKAGYNFILQERSFGSLAFATVPMWVVQIIIPFGFAIISLEYAIGVLLDIFRLIKKENEQ